VNRGTIYLHYLDKFDLLDKIMEEHINNMSNFCESASEMDFIESTVHCMEYFESNYLFFSTMLVSEGAPYFRNRFLQFNLEEFMKDVDICAGITTYSPLKHWHAGPGKRVAIVGMGGLGHVAVQFAHAMGAEVTVLSRSNNKEKEALSFGADHYFATKDPDTFTS
jgi:AcrR family transcriptional regulator